MSNKKLNTRQRNFVENILRGMNQKKAYIEAGYESRGNSAEVNASKLIRKPKVQEKLKQRRQERVIATKSQIAKLLSGALKTHSDIQKIKNLSELSENERKNLKLKLQSAKDILDRCKIGKEEKTQVNIAQKFEGMSIEEKEKKLEEIVES